MAVNKEFKCLATLLMERQSGWAEDREHTEELSKSLCLVHGQLHAITIELGPTRI